MYPHRSLRRARELPWGTAFEAALAKNAISISKVDKPRPAAELQACLSDQGKTMRHLIAPLCLALLIVWVDGLDGVVIPYSHPANPYARSAPPIAWCHGFRRRTSKTSPPSRRGRILDLLDNSSRPIRALLRRRISISTSEGQMSDLSRSIHRKAAVLASLSLAGCTTLSAEGPFSQVADTVQLRLGKQISWDAGQYEDPVVHSTIVRLLSRPLTAERAVQIVLLNSRQLQAIYADLGIAQANLVQAELWKNPILNGSVTFPLAGGTPDYSFDLALKFIDILYIPLRRSVAESQLEEAKLQVTAQVMRVAGQTYSAFIDYLSERQRVAVLTEAVKSAAAIVESGKALRQPGNITDYDFESEVTQQVQVAAELSHAQISAAQARERVNQLMGLAGSQTRWRSADRLPSIATKDPLTADMERKAIEASVDLAAVRQRIITTGRKYRVVDISSLVPQLDVDGEVARTVGENEAGPTFTVELAVFDWGQARRESARVEIQRARDEFTGLAVRIRSVARLQRAKLLSARQTAVYYTNTVGPQTQRLLETAEQQYNVMQLGVFQLLQAKERQIRATLEYVTTLSTYWKERARLAQILAGKLPDETESSASSAAMSGAQNTSGNQL
jgi:outer membrane protein, heavy metal efflux system